MTSKLFVGGLPFAYSNTELQTLFAAAGKVVSAEMVPDPAWGRTRGFGFVEMSTSEEAQAAISQLNGMKVAEKNIYVTVAREKKPSTPQAGTDAGRKPYKKPLNWKAGRINRGAPADPRSPANSGDRPAWPPRRPSTGFSAPPRSGFSGSKRSFSSPQNPKGDFGPSRDRGRPFGKPSRRPASPGSSTFGKPAKKEFWKKFDKKTRKPADE
jgi:RNA recognition motif-containing protein